MTYIAPLKRYRRRRPPRGLAGWLDDALDAITGSVTPVGTGGTADCIAAGNAASAQLDAKTDDLVRNWNPTGFYTSTDMRALVTSTMKVVAQGFDALSQAAASVSAASDSITRATNDLSRASGKSLDYLAAAQQADAQGFTSVNAPGFKRWITDTMGAASSAITTAAAVACDTPWFVNALAMFQSVFDALYAQVKRVVGVLIKIGDLALKIPDGLEQASTILVWALGLGGAAWLLYQAHSSHERTRYR